MSIQLVLGICVMVIYYYLALKFAKKILAGTSKHRWDCLVISIINVAFFYILYSIGSSVIGIFIGLGALLFLEFVGIAKSTIRQVSFGASVFAFNITSISVLVLVCFAHITSTPALEVFQNKDTFYANNFVTYLILISLLILIDKLVPMEKLKGMSLTKLYSEVVTSAAIIMTVYLYIVLWVSLTNELYNRYLYATITSVMIMGVSFYCLFFFNVRLVSLHSYKRKSDQADALHKENQKRQSLAEQKLYTDELTRLYNKRFIYNKLEELCKQDKANFAVVYSDLVALKQVNDKYGHNIGDEYITCVANVLKNSIRADDFVGRIGGDEFLVILFDVEEKDLQILVDRMKKKLQAEDVNENYCVRANIGCAFVGKDDLERDMLKILEKADKLMQEEKREYYEKGGEVK